MVSAQLTDPAKTTETKTLAATATIAPNNTTATTTTATTLTTLVPVLLLKTRSSPGDSYEDLFSAPHDGLAFAPRFVPVLLHRFDDHGMTSTTPTAA
ncbi:hypothetical protein G7046_g9449 [Stylonectria norvegica]|nr:hypothetical protein G7046_g9449 [Stylonectria norvegica]